MVARHSAPRISKCPLCNNELADRREYERVIGELDVAILHKHNELSRKERREQEAVLHDLKANHASQMRALRDRYKEEQALLRKKLVEQSGKEKHSHRKKLADLKKKYQLQMRNIREMDDAENLRIQREAESSLNTQLKEIIQNYGNLASNHQKELERLKKSQDESNVELHKKDSEIARLKISLAKSSSELKVKELSLQINERNNMIKELNGKISELEARLGLSKAAQPRKKEAPSVTEEDDEKQKLKEYMKAIIEITKNQRLEERKRSERGNPKAEKNPEESADSKVDKLLGWFT
ncbi:MAG: hypothetical protein ACREBU_13055 [Nitrososphaera sp.]